MTHPGHEQGDDGDGRSPGSHVIAVAALPSRFPSGLRRAQALRLQLRGRPRTWTLMGTPHYVPSCSPLGEPSPKASCSGDRAGVKRALGGLGTLLAGPVGDQ